MTSPRESSRADFAIKKVRARLVSVPITGTAVAGGRSAKRHVVLVTVETAACEGTYYGWTIGESEAAALLHMVAHVAAAVVGRDARQINANIRRMHAAIQLTGRTGIGLFALGVIECCLWDIKGKECDLPLWRLLGGDGSAPVPVYASALFRDASIDELRAEARELQGAGFGWMKMRVGRPTLDDDLRRIDAVRAVIGDGVQLMMDCAMLWDARTALARIEAFKRFNPFWIEDPIEYHDGAHIDLLAQLRAASPVRIAAGEFQFGAATFQKMIRARAVDFPMVDMQHVGGLTAWLEVVAMGRAEGIVVVPHVFPELAIHVYCIDRPNVPIEWVPWTTELFADFRCENGAVQIPAGPGIGLDVPWKKIAQLALGEPIVVS